MSYFIYTDYLIRSLFDSKLIDPGSTMIYVGTYGPLCFYFLTFLQILLLCIPLSLKNFEFFFLTVNSKGIICGKLNKLFSFEFFCIIILLTVYTAPLFKKLWLWKQ